MTLLSAFMTGCAGPSLTDEEWRFLQKVRPCGLILFTRNCQSPTQVKALIDSFRDAVGSDDLLVAVDQEGGRVQRLQPPHWRKLPPAAAFGALYRDNPAAGVKAASAVSRMVARDLRALGFNMNCAPVLDLPVPGAHGIIGDRAYGNDVASIVALGRAVADGFLAGGILPVIKHIPGHGRATEDTHLALPVIDAPLEDLAATDFAPFRALADLPAAMTAHVVLAPVDARRPVSVSRPAIERIIRQEIGFDGLLICDDLSMAALSGDLGGRARAAIEAGCDIALHCNGRLAEMEQVAESVPLLEGRPAERFAAALDRCRAVSAFDASEALAALEAALGPGSRA